MNNDIASAPKVHKGDPIWELHINGSRGPENQRTTFYGTCRVCSWQSRNRTSASTVERDWRAHVAEKSQ